MFTEQEQKVVQLRYNDKVVGRYYYGDQEFHKTLNTEHWMWSFQAFGLSIKVIENLIQKGCKNVIIHFEGKPIKNPDDTTTPYEISTYSCELRQFIESSIKRNNDKEVGMEEDWQKFVRKKDMKTIKRYIEGQSSLEQFQK